MYLVSILCFLSQMLGEEGGGREGGGREGGLTKRSG